jgi:uncharacterized protein YaiI (UPF0178 family)
VRIFVDADSCPPEARGVVLRAAEKRRMKAIFAANKRLADVQGKFASIALCGHGPDAADNYIVTHSEAGDLAVTRDVPLAFRLAERGVAVLNDRGRVFTTDGLRSFMAARKVRVGVTENGIRVDKIANYGKKEVKMFADSFDRLLTALAGPAPPNSKRYRKEEARRREEEAERKRQEKLERRFRRAEERRRLAEIEYRKQEEAMRKLRAEAVRKREEKMARMREREQAREKASKSAESVSALRKAGKPSKASKTPTVARDINRK